MDGYEGETPTRRATTTTWTKPAPAGLAFAVHGRAAGPRATGKGGLIEFPQAENVMQEIGEYFLDLPDQPPQPARYRQLRPACAAGRLADCRGRRVGRHLDPGRPGLGGAQRRGRRPDWCGLGSPRHSAAAQCRRAAGAIAEWTRADPAEVVMARLQAAGIPAGEVMSETRLLSDPHLEEGTGSRTAATRRWAAIPIRATRGAPPASKSPSAGRCPASARTTSTCTRVLGYSDEQYDDLVRRGLRHHRAVRLATHSSALP